MEPALTWKGRIKRIAELVSHENHSSIPAKPFAVHDTVSLVPDRNMVRRGTIHDPGFGRAIPKIGPPLSFWRQLPIHKLAATQNIDEIVRVCRLLVGRHYQLDLDVLDLPRRVSL